MNTEKLRILLADDDAEDRLLFKEALGELKIKTALHAVKDGEELMIYLNQEDLKKPDLIFLDLNMPKKNGLECLIEIRTKDAFKEVAIVIYSTSSNDKDVEDTFTNGANVYLKKPDRFEVLKDSLHKILESTNIYREPPFNFSNFLLKL